jgi:CHAT domain-containing protein/tetratricopeptide (TPR) repeat protein
MARAGRFHLKRALEFVLVFFPALTGVLFGQATLPEAFQCPACSQPTNPPNYTVPSSLPSFGGSTPGPYTVPSIDQTRAYINSQPALRTLDPGFKDAITYSGAGSGLLNSAYLPNGQPNPFSNPNGTVNANWYLPSTWPSTGVNWQGVNSSGFLPNTSAPLYTNPYYSPTSSLNNVSTYQPTYQTPPQTYSQPASVQKPVQPSTQSTQGQYKTPTEGYPNFGPRPADIQKAQENREHSLALSEAAGDKLGEAINHAALAEIFVERGDPEQAFKHLNLAEPIMQSVGDSKQQADLFRIKGAAYLSSGEFDEAIKAYGQAITIVTSRDDQKSEAEILTSIGWVYQSLGEPQTALKDYEEALSLFVKMGNREGEGRARLGIAVLYQSLGQLSEAQAQYNSLLPIASKAQMIALLSSVGEFHQSRNRFSDALMRYQMALELIRSMGDRMAEGGILAGMGRCQMGLGVDALQHRLVASAGATIVVNLPATERDFQEAQGLFDQARSLMREAGNRAGEAGVIASMGELDYWNGISPLYFGVDSRGRYFPKALKHYDEALSLMRATGNRAGEIGVLTNIGLVYDAWGKPRQALSYYTQALRRMDELQTYARLEEFRIDLAEQSANLYGRAVLLAVSLKQINDAFDLTERARARTFLDQLGNKRIDLRAHMPEEFALREQELRRENISLERQLGQELAKPVAEINPERTHLLDLKLSLVRAEYERWLTRLKVSSPEYASFLSISPLTLSEAQQQLAPDETLISYFTTPDITLAFVVTRANVRVTKLRVTERELAVAVTTFRDFSGQSGSSPNLKQLYKWLIAPIRSQLKTSMIAIVPHGVLHDLPFAALTPDGKEYFGDSHEIFSLPSVSVLPYITAKIKPGGNRILVLANNNEEGSPYLSHAYGEAEAVASLFGTEPRLGSAATGSVLLANAGDYNIVHVIAHTDRSSKTPQFASIELPSGKGDGGGALELNQLYGLDLRQTNLVVLSGCQSELGRQSRGDDIVSLSRAFMYAGSPSVIASLWSVDDEATQQLMTAFYTYLKQGLGKAAALRAAQADIRRKYPNPYYWAAFVLTGNPV